jgi:hypothetical protein
VLPSRHPIANSPARVRTLCPMRVLGGVPSPPIHDLQQKKHIIVDIVIHINSALPTWRSARSIPRHPWVYIAFHPLILILIFRPCALAPYAALSSPLPRVIFSPLSIPPKRNANANLTLTRTQPRRMHALQEAQDEVRFRARGERESGDGGWVLFLASKFLEVRRRGTSRERAFREEGVGWESIGAPASVLPMGPGGENQSPLWAGGQNRTALRTDALRLCRLQIPPPVLPVPLLNSSRRITPR